MSLRYGVSHMGSSTTFEIRADGTATYASTGGPAGKRDVRANATPEEVDALVRVLREHRFCSLRSGRSTGVPDEARPVVSVRVGDVDCVVKLWDGEWRDDEHARACLAAVEALGRTLAKRGE